MIVGIFHQGSGLGNQLHRYVMTRVLAEDKGYEWGMLINNNDSSKEPNFKGASIFKGDFYGTNPVARGWPTGFSNFTEKKVVENGIDIRSYDPEINFVQDNTVIDGEFQDERYFEHRLGDIREWLKVEPLKMSDNLCIIGFRGGEYKSFPDLFLDIKYWDNCVEKMRIKYPKMQFRVVTDDPATAHEFFPEFEITHDVAMDWRQVRYAKHLIIANSSFYILPALLNEEVKEVLAPRFWARHNVGIWALPQNYYKKFTYM